MTRDRVLLAAAMLSLCGAGAALAAERMTVITYFNMTRADEEQVKLIDGKWQALVRDERVALSVADLANGYVEFVDEGTGGGKEEISAALFLAKDKAPMLAVLRITGSSGSCPDPTYGLTTYTLEAGKLRAATDIVPKVPLGLFFENGYTPQESGPEMIPAQEYRLGYKLPRKGTTLEAFLDTSTAACTLGAFGDQLSAASRAAHEKFLANVRKEPVTLKWNKASGHFDPPAAAAPRSGATVP